MKDLNQKTLFGEKVITSHEEYIDNEQVQIFITIDANKEYYNVYTFNEKYKIDKLNSLCLQEPVEVITVDLQDHFTIGYMISKIMEYIIWDRFYKYGVAEISLSIDFDPH